MEFNFTNIYYFSVISKIGGIETFFYQLARKYKDIDLTIVYKIGDPIQVARLQQFVRCIKYETGMQFKCKRAFFNFNTDIIDSVEAEDYYLVVHGDYEAMMKQGQLFTPPQHSKITKYIGVSERACKGYTAVTGKKCELCYNPFIIEKPKKVLNLISATRLSKEKGRKRMIQLAEMLDRANIPYLWTVFTNDTDKIDNPNIIYMEPRLDILNYIANADYLVQLSDNEGYCYSVIEALTSGTPVLTTPCPVFQELGLKDGENCYILPFDMKNVDVNKIYNNIPTFKFTPPEDNWGNLLVNAPNTWLEDKDSTYLVEATSEYKERKISDNQLGKIPEPRTRWKVDYDRMLVLTGCNKRKIVFAKVIQKIKPIKK